MSVENAPLGSDVYFEGKAREAAVLDGESQEPRDYLRKHHGRRHSRCNGPGTEQVGLRCLPAFTAYGGVAMAGGGTHKWSSAPTGSQRGTGATWRSRREQQGQSCTFLLCPGTLLPALGPVCTDGGKKGPPKEPVQLDTKWVSGRAGKANGDRQQRSLFSA